MFIQQIYTTCLAQAAYYIESNGEAAVIDPLRDYDTYLQMANQRGAKIKYIFETHFHADFVSGHIDLAQKTGATIVYGPTTKTNYKVHVAADNEVLKLGDINITVLHTPGHTPESSCFLLTDKNGKTHSVFTGDTLFVGDVGRPDLLDGVITKEELAGMMYDSLHNKLLPLEDDVIVYPAHGAGSACGKNIGKETFSTIGEQRKANYALQPMSKTDFIKTVTAGIQPAPAYFFKDATLNKQGYAAFDDVLKQALKPLAVADAEAAIKNNITIIDTRIPDVFELGFVPSSLNFGLNGQYAIWAATLLDITSPIMLVTEAGKEQESAERLTRVGFDNIKGFLKGGFEAWIDAEKRFDMIISIDDEEFELDVKHTEVSVLDVRKPGEYNDLHVDKAQHLSLDNITTSYKNLDPNKEYLIYCAGGYRSMIAASFLRAKGFKLIKNVWGGFGKIKERGGLNYVSGLAKAN